MADVPALDAFDYSWARPDPQQMKAAGIKVVSRYLFGPGKGVTRAEVDALHAAGIGVLLNYEANAGNHLLGAAQGTADGNAARSWAAQLGAPVGLPIYYSCDRDTPAALIPTALAYLRAADSAAHPSRCYAQYDVVEAFGRPAWQTVAWSGGQLSSHAVLYQWAIEKDFHGSQVDYDEIRDITSLGAWWPAGSPNIPITEESFMAALSDEQQREMFNVLHFLGAAFKDGTPNLKVTGEFGLALRALRDTMSQFATETDLAAVSAKLDALALQVASLEPGGTPTPGGAPTYEGTLTLTPRSTA